MSASSVAQERDERGERLGRERGRRPHRLAAVAEAQLAAAGVGCERPAGVGLAGRDLIDRGAERGELGALEPLLVAPRLVLRCAERPGIPDDGARDAVVVDPQRLVRGRRDAAADGVGGEQRGAHGLPATAQYGFSPGSRCAFSQVTNADMWRSSAPPVLSPMIVCEVKPPGGSTAAGAGPTIRS